MKTKMLIVEMVLVVACLSGCITPTDDDMTGTYRCDADDDDGVLYLLNGEYEMLSDEKYGGIWSFGNYTIRDDTVRLEIACMDIMIPFTIDGRDLIDPDGDRWVRD